MPDAGISFKDYDHCLLCPRVCGTNRNQGAKGFCRQTSQLKIASMVAHHGEEPPISGTHGSGTLFYTGCSTGCFFCQNWQISKEDMGEPYDMEGFVAAVKALCAKGVHNINHVTPDHFWPHIRALIVRLKSENIHVPHLINCSGYQALATVREMVDHADIFLPDFKLADDALSGTCMGRSDYPEAALNAIALMVDAKGALDTWPDEETGRCEPATRGVLVRHLLLPGEPENSIRALTLLYERFGPTLPISLMSQFRPTPYCSDKGEFMRQVDKDEYGAVVAVAESLGFEKVFVQPLEMDDTFYPDFRKSEPFKGNKS